MDESGSKVFKPRDTFRDDKDQQGYKESQQTELDTVIASGDAQAAAAVLEKGTLGYLPVESMKRIPPVVAASGDPELSMSMLKYYDIVVDPEIRQKLVDNVVHAGDPVIAYFALRFGKMNEGQQRNIRTVVENGENDWAKNALQQLDRPREHKDESPL